MIRMRRVIFMWLLFVFAHTSFASEPVHEATGSAMGMKWSVKWVGGQEGAVIKQDISALLTEIEKEMSTYRADSESSKFNVTRGTNWYPVSTNLMRAIEASLEIAAKSGGALDPTVYPLVQAWGFGPVRRVGQMPTVTEVAIARTKVGHTNVQVRASPLAVRKLRPFVSLDVSAVAMGLAADLAKARLQQLGYANFLIDMGGEFAAVGEGPEGKGWPVGIEQPGSEGKRIQRVVMLKDESLATSGDDRNFREINGKRYHHIIDPRTGWPAETQIASATVIHSSCALADGWATAMVVMGRERGLALAKENKLRVILLERDGSGFREFIHPQEP